MSLLTQRAQHSAASLRRCRHTPNEVCEPSACGEAAKVRRGRAESRRTRLGAEDIRMVRRSQTGKQGITGIRSVFRQMRIRPNYSAQWMYAAFWGWAKMWSLPILHTFSSILLLRPDDARERWAARWCAAVRFRRDPIPSIWPLAPGLQQPLASMAKGPRTIAAVTRGAALRSRTHKSNVHSRLPGSSTTIHRFVFCLLCSAVRGLVSWIH